MMPANLVALMTCWRHGKTEKLKGQGTAAAFLEAEVLVIVAGPTGGVQRAIACNYRCSWIVALGATWSILEVIYYQRLNCCGARSNVQGSWRRVWTCHGFL
jgi:hypothetical protein